MNQAALFDSAEFTTAAAPETSGAVVYRYFHRCADCLSVVVLDREYHRADCGECGGRMEYMGRTHQNRSLLVKDAWRCPCDVRCTHAPGPHCECRCGGKNHGSGLWVPVLETAGVIPVVQTHPGSKKYADHYRGLVDQVRAAIDKRYGAAMMRKHAGEYLDGDAYRQYCRGSELMRRLRTIQAMRVHAGRNKKLEAMIREVA